MGSRPRPRGIPTDRLAEFVTHALAGTAANIGGTEQILAGTPLTGQRHRCTAPGLTRPRPARTSSGYRPRARSSAPCASIDDNQFKPIIGSSFAAAYGPGVAALVRAKFPQMPATEVIHP